MVGCGYWGKNLVRNFAELGALACICDSDAAKLATQESLYPGVELNTSVQAMLQRADIDAVVIASPAALHFEHAAMALAFEKDLFIEKPLALRYAHGLELVARARALGRVLMVGHVLEYHPAIQALRAMVARGDLGELRYLYSNRLNLGKVRQEENILWSFAPHDISIISTLVGEIPSSVSASGAAYLQKGIYDTTLTNLTFGGALRGHIFVSWLHPNKEQRLTVIGDQKMAVFDDTLIQDKLRILDRGIQWKDGFPVAKQGSDIAIPLETAEPLRLECRHFLNCVESREEPLTGGENALRVLKVLEASQLSLDLGGTPVSTASIDETAALV